MKRILLYSLIFSAIVIFTLLFSVKLEYTPDKGKYITLTPSLTEIVYAVGAEDNLVGVTSVCDYPEEAKKKPKVGNMVFLNKEEIIKLKPEYIFASEFQKPFLDDLKYLNIKMIYFKYNNLEDINKTIREIGSVTKHSKEAKAVIKDLKEKEKKLKAKKPKKIVFIVHVNPLVTIGKKCFITDAILKTGHDVVTKNINKEHYQVSLEYLLASKPEVVIVVEKNVAEYLKSFLDAKYVILTPEERSLTVRPSPRIIQSMKKFASI